MSSTLRRSLALVLSLLAIGILCVAGGVTVGSSSNAESNPIPVLGLLGASPAQFAAERAAGVQAVTVQVGWDDAEPTAGSLDPSYITGIVDHISQAEQQGLQVILDPGLQYPPNWLLAMPGSQIRQPVRRRVLGR